VSSSINPSMEDPNIFWRDSSARKVHELSTHFEKVADRPTEVLRLAKSAKSEATEDNDNYRSDPSVLFAFGLGMTFASGAILGLFGGGVSNFGFYLASLAVFHLLEYQYVHRFHPTECNYSSFILTHSKEAHFAIAAAILEYFLEYLIFPSLKSNWFIMYPALFVVILTQSIRTTAMWTAGKNFHHQVREKREEGHKLVTHGIYSYSRHPSYFGWFWWSIFTQILLCNPICIVLYMYMSWQFFDGRIREEEETLVRFFGDDYIQYKKKVPVGIPLIS